MEQHEQIDPSLGIVNPESITDGIQNCHMTLEESRVRLQPFMKILLDEDEQQHADTTTTPQDYSDEDVVQVFSECLDRTFGSVDMLMVRLADSGLVHPVADDFDTANNTHANNNDDNVYLLMASNCTSKALEFIGHHCLTLLEADSLDGVGPLDDGSTIQPSMAHLAELTLRIYHVHSTLIPSQINSHNKDDDDDEAITPQTIIEAYAQYQRRCLRTRSKPAISSLAELRNLASSQNCFVSDLLDAEKRRQQLEVGIDDDEEGNENEDGIDGTTDSRGQPHAEALTIILGEGSSLIQPLAAWRDALAPQCEKDNDICSLLQQLCQESIELLDTEAQTLASTVGSWFSSDQRGIATLDHDDNTTNNITDATKSDLLSIESSLEEMAFLCQVISRYCLFSEQTVGTNNNNGGASSTSNETKKLQDLLTEQSLHYSTLETRLATLQFNQAISLASPQLIELGRPSLQVPSIVEDAHFVCVRAIERASGTRSERAVWTVGHWVCEVWGIDQSSGMMMGGGGAGAGEIKGVYRALMEGIGCVGENNNMNHADDINTAQTSDAAERPSPPKSGNAFAAALLEELDDDEGQGLENGGGSNPGSAVKSAPASGGISSFFGRGGNGQSLQSRIDAELCALNGISAAETALFALSGLFADLVEEKKQEEEAVTNTSRVTPAKSSMLTFARDELASHSRSYHKLLEQRVRTLVADLCGGDDMFDCDGQLCLQNLRLFIEKEVYNLDGSSFRSLEGEDRLEAEMIGPIRQSQMFNEIGKDKCDAVVVLQVSKTMAMKSAEIILQFLLQGNTEFNEWGALLLSKQVRMLQNVYCGLVLASDSGNTADVPSSSSSISTASILAQFERVNQAVSILQLEKPSDWLAFSYKVGDSNETNLTADEIQKVMGLRLDFTEEAIARVCIQIGANT